MRDRRAQSGFTLLEMMITVAVIAILAAIAVPLFSKETRKNKAASEVPPIFNDMRTRLEQYNQENGAYPASLGEATMWPTAAPSTTQHSIVVSMPATWTAIKMRITGNDMVYCGYTWVSGLANVAPTGGVATASFGFTTPSVNWYYLLARCNMDNNAALDEYFFSSSTNPIIQTINAGN
jgi:prepilin-type N-terminal cleavage/methylation domain-containing protein